VRRPDLVIGSRLATQVADQPGTVARQEPSAPVVAYREGVSEDDAMSTGWTEVAT
jgi:hypothetical protein